MLIINTVIGKNIKRKESWDKVTGKAKYTDDLTQPGMLCACLLTSTYAHAKIISIDTSEAVSLEGVHAIITGKDGMELFGPLVLDRPVLAKDTVRYAGEPVAIVVAKDEMTAKQAITLIHVKYEELPLSLTPSESLKPDTILIHKQTNGYKKIMTDIYPKEGTNIASHYCIDKGNTKEAFIHCDVVVEQKFSLPPSDHIAMEVRTAHAEISADGKVFITTSSQSPYAVRKQISDAFLIPVGNIQVHVSFIGGGFGGKAPVTLELLAFIASRSVGGKAVRLTITREQDMATTPCRMGLDATVKIGAKKDGMIQSAELFYQLDCGAYTDISPYMAKAIAVDCTGPYRIDNLYCESLCVYTNHTYVTSYRGFAHESYTFCIERVLDLLAQKCDIDPFEIRIKNAILPGCLTPTQVKCTPSLTGDLKQCLYKIKQLAQWDHNNVTVIKDHIVRAKGIACFWKTENPPTNAVTGACITFNSDGSVNLNTGVVEMGSGGQTHLAQILAEKLKIAVDQVHVVMSVDTRTAPEHWKTVASMTEYMTGRAVLRAAEDILDQLRINGSLTLGCSQEDIAVANGSVYSIKNPKQFILFKDIVQGYQSPEGESIGEPVIGRGGFMLKGLSMLDRKDGKGKTGPAWTPGAQVVEIEANLEDFSYRIISASTVMDVGKAINPDLMRAVIAGGMAMGISMSSRESFVYNDRGILQNPNLRTYKLMHIGQEPDYRVDFVETPEEGSPYGIRSYAEHGIIGIPAALANALSVAFGVNLSIMPLTPENIWNTKVGKQDDSI